MFRFFQTTQDRQHEKGQGLVEYALILVLVAVVVIVILALLGPSIGNIFSNLMTVLGGETAPAMSLADALSFCSIHPQPSVAYTGCMAGLGYPGY